MRLGTVALVVRDYDEAIDYFTQKLGFALIEDSDLGSGKRWVRVSLPGRGADLLIAKAVNDEQRAAIGRAGGGRVCYFLYTGQFWDTYRAMLAKGVEFAEEPRDEPYGWVVVFKDLYGNLWDLVETDAPGAGNAS